MTMGSCAKEAQQLASAQGRGEGLVSGVPDGDGGGGVVCERNHRGRLELCPVLMDGWGQGTVPKEGGVVGGSVGMGDAM